MVFKEENNYSGIHATFTVGELSEYIKNTLEKNSHLRNFEVIGEISNHFQSSSGHNYFSLKDEKAVIRCVMFRDASGIEFIKDGQQISAQGYVSFYKSRGDLQIYVNKVQPEGVGSLQKNFELLIETLLGLQDGTVQVTNITESTNGMEIVVEFTIVLTEEELVETDFDSTEDFFNSLNEVKAEIADEGLVFINGCTDSNATNYNFDAFILR